MSLKIDTAFLCATDDTTDDDRRQPPPPPPDRRRRPTTDDDVQRCLWSCGLRGGVAEYPGRWKIGKERMSLSWRMEGRWEVVFVTRGKMMKTTTLTTATTCADCT
jgi:hypothetical protein